MTKIDNPVSGYHFATKHVFLQSMYVAHRVSEEMAKRSSSPFGESSVKIVHLVLKISTCLCFIKVYIVKFALVCIVFLALFGDLALNVLYSNVSFFAVLMASKFDPGSH